MSHLRPSHFRGRWRCLSLVSTDAETSDRRTLSAPAPILPIAPGRRPRSSSANAASPPPAKRTRASAPSNSPANAEAGPSGYREESVDPSNNDEIGAVEAKLEGGDTAFDSEAVSGSLASLHDVDSAH